MEIKPVMKATERRFVIHRIKECRCRYTRLDLGKIFFPRDILRIGMIDHEYLFHNGILQDLFRFLRMAMTDDD